MCMDAMHQALYQSKDPLVCQNCQENKPIIPVQIGEQTFQLCRECLEAKWHEFDIMWDEWHKGDYEGI